MQTDEEIKFLDPAEAIPAKISVKRSPYFVSVRNSRKFARDSDFSELPLPPPYLRFIPLSPVTSDYIARDLLRAQLFHLYVVAERDVSLPLAAAVFLARHGRRPIEVFNRVLREIAEETLFSIPGGLTVKAVVKFMGEREMREVGN